jgi:proliferating cell nuclear antigen PCNA
MPIIFKAKSQEAYCIKILIELLTNNIKTGCFVIDENGISLCMMDHHRKILVDLSLKAENFSIFKFNSKKIYLGINLNHFNKLIRSVKKKDTIELSIDDESPTDLCIKVIPKENNRITTSYVKIQNIQNLDIDLPTGYDKPIIVSSSEYQKTLKDLGNLGNTVKITSRNYQIEFHSDAGGILKRNVQFGEVDDSETEGEEFSQEFATEQLCRITKLSGLGTNIQIYPGKPLLFKSNIGTLGKIAIYIKSKEQIDSESCTVDTDSESE